MTKITEAELNEEVYSPEVDPELKRTVMAAANALEQNTNAIKGLIDNNLLLPRSGNISRELPNGDDTLTKITRDLHWHSVVGWGIAAMVWTCPLN